MIMIIILSYLCKDHQGVQTNDVLKTDDREFGQLKDTTLLMHIHLSYKKLILQYRAFKNSLLNLK